MKKWLYGIVLLTVLCLLTGPVLAEKKPYFPDIPGYQTLVCDFHMHTVFSDGQVWPTVRVDEAVRERLDAIAITDHIEYQPHKNDIPTNHNRPYEIAAEYIQKKKIDVLLIKGAEITRDTPPGHYNAIFTADIDPLDTPEFLDAIRNANKQKAFVFWNHHTWKGQARGRWEQVQTTMVENQWLHGMEVANGGTYYPLAHQWCLDKNLTLFGNSDIHIPSNFYRYTAGRHRTVTLVFALKRSVESIQEALVAGRTAVWLNNQIIGRQDFLRPLFEAAVTFAAEPADSEGAFIVTINNTALIDLDLQREDTADSQHISVPARSEISVLIHTDPEQEVASLSYQVRNFLMAPDQGLLVRIPLTEPALVVTAD